MDDDPRSLRSVFAAAEEQRLALESSATHNSDAVADALQAYRDCLGLIAALALFSPNESVDDVATVDLPYLLVNYHVAELTQKLTSSSPRERKHLLTAARDAYERYLHLVDSYDLLAPPYRNLLERYTESPLDFSTVAASDAAARRDAKIANFKAEKELRAKLDFLRRRPGYADPDGTAGGGGGGGGDEEAVRETHLAHLHYCTHMAFQALEGLNREWDVLAQAPDDTLLAVTTTQETEDARRRARGGESGDGFTERLDQPLRRLPGGGAMGGPLLTRQGKPLQPFTLLGSRQELAKGVFRPGHNLPTMTIDEYLEEERRRGGIIEGGGEASGRRPEVDEDDYEKADAETMKARAWDEFTEANPRGSGNTLNKG